MSSCYPPWWYPLAFRRQGRSSTGTPNKKGAPRGGGRKGGQISLSGTAPGRASAIGALGLIRANACLVFPKIDRVEDYLISLANPVRDVTAMKVRTDEGRTRTIHVEGIYSLGGTAHTWMGCLRSPEDSVEVHGHNGTRAGNLSAEHN